MVPTKTQQSANEKARDYVPRGERLKGQIAVVTGADSGIGQATAIAFAQEGADVAIPVHKDRQGSERTRELAEEAGVRTLVHDLDQEDPESVSRFFQKVRDELGTPTILVNNAGVDSTGKEVAEMSIEEWHHEIAVNLHGPFYCTKEYLKGMLEKIERDAPAEAPEDPREWTNGVILNITTVHQEVPRAGAAGYDSSKGGLRNLTRTLSLELAEKRIRVVNIAPGMVLTPFNQPAIDSDETYKKQVESIPVKRAALPNEIANVAVFLASKDASYIHGTTVFVDGGLMMNQGQGA